MRKDAAWCIESRAEAARFPAIGPSSPSCHRHRPPVAVSVGRCSFRSRRIFLATRALVPRLNFWVENVLRPQRPSRFYMLVDAGARARATKQCHARRDPRPASASEYRQHAAARVASHPEMRAGVAPAFGNHSSGTLTVRPSSRWTTRSPSRNLYAEGPGDFQVPEITYATFSPEFRSYAVSPIILARPNARESSWRRVDQLGLGVGSPSTTIPWPWALTNRSCLN